MSRACAGYPMSPYFALPSVVLAAMGIFALRLLVARIAAPFHGNATVDHQITFQSLLAVLGTTIFMSFRLKKARANFRDAHFALL